MKTHRDVTTRRDKGAKPRRRGSDKAPPPRRRKAWVLATVAAAAILLALALLQSAQGRILLSRLPLRDSIQRLVFGGPQVPRADAYGIDVSRYQGEIRWGEVGRISFSPLTRRQGLDSLNANVAIDFAFAKATEGGDFADPNIAANRRGIRSAGIAYGAYHVLTLANADSQVANFVRTARLRRGDLRPAIDIEDGILGSARMEAVCDTLRRVAAGLDRAYGARAIVYSSLRFMERLSACEALTGRPLWIARYLSDERPATADIWQFAENGQVAGIDEPVDLDALYFDRLRLGDLRLE